MAVAGETGAFQNERAVYATVGSDNVKLTFLPSDRVPMRRKVDRA